MIRNVKRGKKKARDSAKNWNTSTRNGKILESFSDPGTWEKRCQTIRPLGLEGGERRDAESRHRNGRKTPVNLGNEVKYWLKRKTRSRERLIRGLKRACRRGARRRGRAVV